MRRDITIACISFLLAVAVSWTAFARLVEDWSYERLFKESDLIVIAQPTKSENSTDRLRDNPWKTEFLGVNTKFHVEHVLKGNFDVAELTLLHFKTDALIVNGPSLVSFRTNSLKYVIQKEGHAGKEVENAGPGTYLLFLRTRADGRFQPVSGQVDPVFSVREIAMPIAAEE